MREAIVGSGGDLDRAARALVDAANQGGGEDNITVVLFELSAASEGAIDDTETMPTSLAASPDPDDEDTLSGLEPVSAVDTAVLSAEDVQRELAPRRRRIRAARP